MNVHAIQGATADKAAQGVERGYIDLTMGTESIIPFPRSFLSILPSIISQPPSLLFLVPLSTLYPALPNRSVHVPEALSSTNMPSFLPPQAASHPTLLLTVCPGPYLTLFIDRAELQGGAQAWAQ